MPHRSRARRRCSASGRSSPGARSSAPISPMRRHCATSSSWIARASSKLAVDGWPRSLASGGKVPLGPRDHAVEGPEQVDLPVGRALARVAAHLAGTRATTVQRRRTRRFVLQAEHHPVARRDADRRRAADGEAVDRVHHRGSTVRISTVFGLGAAGASARSARRGRRGGPPSEWSRRALRSF